MFQVLRVRIHLLVVIERFLRRLVLLEGFVDCVGLCLNVAEIAQREVWLLAGRCIVAHLVWVRFVSTALANYAKV